MGASAGVLPQSTPSAREDSELRDIQTALGRLLPSSESCREASLLECVTSETLFTLSRSLRHLEAW